MRLRIHLASAVATVALIGGVVLIAPVQAANIHEQQIAAASQAPGTANEPATPGSQPKTGNQLATGAGTATSPSTGAGTGTPSAGAEPGTGNTAAMAAEKSTDSDKMSGMSGGKGMHSALMEKHIKELHARLKITQEQEQQWENVVQVMRENAETMDSLVNERAENAKSMSAVEDLKAYGEIAEAHAEGVKKFSAAFQSLYDSMSDAQKKSADALFRNRISERMHGHHPRTAQPG